MADLLRVDFDLELPGTAWSWCVVLTEPGQEQQQFSSDRSVRSPKPVPFTTTHGRMEIERSLDHEPQSSKVPKN